MISINAGKTANHIHPLFDRIQLLAWPRGKQLPQIPGFAVVRDTFVHSQTKVPAYPRVRVLGNPKTMTTIYLQYKPARPSLAPVKMTIISQARNGPRRSELQRISEVFRRTRLLLVEFAMDFPAETNVDRDFVPLHGLFGKSEPQPPSPQSTLRYGTRRSEFMVRAYPRVDKSFRVEIEAHSRWLRRTRVSEIADLARLPILLLPKQASFHTVDWQHLRAHLYQKNRTSADRILARCRERASSLHGLLNYLRGDIGLKNARRFLRPHPLNDELQTAAREWAREWHKATENNDDR